MWRALLADYVEKRFTPCYNSVADWQVVDTDLRLYYFSDRNRSLSGSPRHKRAAPKGVLNFLCFAWSMWLCSLTHYCFFFHFAFVSAFSANFWLIDDTHHAISSFVMHYSMTKLFVFTCNSQNPAWVALFNWQMFCMNASDNKWESVLFGPKKSLDQDEKFLYPDRLAASASSGPQDSLQSSSLRPRFPMVKVTLYLLSLLPSMKWIVKLYFLIYFSLMLSYVAIYCKPNSNCIVIGAGLS